ncbi:hypothetical protein BSL78_09047 [Apostichopus japonicus]|uniref:EGF-like domain-containing protein n=1 Tax=Stichopus japonicus TaxID=307972 RepID=A0A2G8L1D5_STIJA|nr:hypothetical protein BSL78_09047 [Apostichopus japonicus]
MVEHVCRDWITSIVLVKNITPVGCVKFIMASVLSIASTMELAWSQFQVSSVSVLNCSQVNKILILCNRSKALLAFKAMTVLFQLTTAYLIPVQIMVLASVKMVFTSATVLGYTVEYTVKRELITMEINECSSEPCFNEGFCVDLENDFACSCLNGFMGDLCEIDVNLCQNQPCLEYATCVDLDTRYVCVCPAGKTGSHCEEQVTPCVSHPCQNGGTCLNEGMLGEVRSMEFSYRCECVAGYTGVNCQLDVNECDSHPCSNNGTCHDLSNSYTCQCPPGFNGSQCESVEDPCVSSPCLNGGTCVDTDVIGQFKCQCTRDYGGRRCQDILQWCINCTCMNGGSCLDDICTCDCPKGFRGTVA